MSFYKSFQHYTESNSYFLREDYIVGNKMGGGGAILKTTDGGITWEQKESGTKNFLYSVKFTNKEKGYAVGMGGIILATADSGNTWLIQTSDYKKNFNCVFFLNENIGYVAGSKGTIMKYMNQNEK